eukprot:24187-Pelagococcus_subviridis.AAC.1
MLCSTPRSTDRRRDRFHTRHTATAAPILSYASLASLLFSRLLSLPLRNQSPHRPRAALLFFFFPPNPGSDAPSSSPRNKSTRPGRPASFSCGRIASTRTSFHRDGAHAFAKRFGATDATNAFAGEPASASESAAALSRIMTTWTSQLAFDPSSKNVVVTRFPRARVVTLAFHHASALSGVPSERFRRSFASITGIARSRAMRHRTRSFSTDSHTTAVAPAIASETAPRARDPMPAPPPPAPPPAPPPEDEDAVSALAARRHAVDAAPAVRLATTRASIASVTRRVGVVAFKSFEVFCCSGRCSLLTSFPPSPRGRERSGAERRSSCALPAEARPPPTAPRPRPRPPPGAAGSTTRARDTTTTPSRARTSISSAARTRTTGDGSRTRSSPR